MPCATPQTSRIGKIQTVKIEADPHPVDLIVNTGDEIPG